MASAAALAYSLWLHWLKQKTTFPSPFWSYKAEVLLIHSGNEAKQLALFSPRLWTGPPRPLKNSVPYLSHPFPTKHSELRSEGTRTRRREGGRLLPCFLLGELNTARGSGARTGQTEEPSTHCEVSKAGLDGLVFIPSSYLTSPPPTYPHSYKGRSISPLVSLEQTHLDNLLCSLCSEALAKQPGNFESRAH